MLIGYARTSTFEQDAGLEAQQRDLETIGCKKIYAEKVSSVARRERLEAALSDLREGDVLVVTKLDRLARSMRDLLAIIDRVSEVKASLRILAMNLDTANATSKLIVHVLGSVAEWERETMLERQREGIEKAKTEGKYKGRKPTARAKGQMVIRLAKEGLGATAISRELKIGRASVYRILNSAP